MTYQSSPFAPPVAYRGRNMTLHGIELVDVRMFDAMGYFPSTKVPRHVVVDVKCRCCGSRAAIISWPIINHAAAICPDCCAATVEHPDGESGHQFMRYSEDPDRCCNYCGIPRNCTDYDHGHDYEF